MKITRACMEVVDVDGSLVRGYPKVTLKSGKRREISMIFMPQARRPTPTADIRLHVVDADLAGRLGQESGDHYVLMDWFQVYDALVSIYNDRITVVGYQYGAEGSRRNGESPVEPGRRGNPIDDYDRPLIRVRWDLW